MAHGTYTYTKWDEKVVSEVEGGPKVAHAEVVFVYNGLITGEGRARFLLQYLPDGTGTFIGYEQVTGSVDGKAGSFVLSHNGTYDSNGISLTFEVLAGTGTGELSGLAATGSAAAAGGEKDVPYTLTFR